MVGLHRLGVVDDEEQIDLSASGHRRTSVELGTRTALARSLGAAFGRNGSRGRRRRSLRAEVVRHDSYYTDNYGALEAAVVEFYYEDLESTPTLPWANDVNTMPPSFRVVDGPHLIARGFYTVDDRRIPLGAEIETDIGDLTIKMYRHEPPDPDYEPPPPASQ